LILIAISTAFTNAHKRHLVAYPASRFRRARPTVKLSGSGGTGETRMNGSREFWQATPARERQSRCPLQLVLGRRTLEQETVTCVRKHQIFQTNYSG